jgi:hypothetical protein
VALGVVTAEAVIEVMTSTTTITAGTVDVSVSLLWRVIFDCGIVRSVLAGTLKTRSNDNSRRHGGAYSPPADGGDA